MISTNDCMLILASIGKATHKDVSKYISMCVKSKIPPREVLEFIDINRPLDLKHFYEHLRESYNNHRSKLYINIMKELQEDKVKEVVTTLNSYALQVTLFGQKLDSAVDFYQQSRLSDVYKCLYNYTQTNDLIPCIKLLKLIKIDIKLLESSYRNIV